MGFEKAKQRAYERLTENNEREAERIIWVGVVLIALFAGFILGGVCVNVMETETVTVKAKGNDIYYTVGVYYSPDTLETENGNLFCVSGTEIDPLTRYMLKLNGNGTETVVDDEILEIVPMD